MAKQIGDWETDQAARRRLLQLREAHAGRLLAKAQEDTRAVAELRAELQSDSTRCARPRRPRWRFQMNDEQPEAGVEQPVSSTRADAFTALFRFARPGADRRALKTRLQGLHGPLPR